MKFPRQSRHSSTGGDTKEVIIVLTDTTQKTGRQNTYTHVQPMNHVSLKKAGLDVICVHVRVITWHICCSALNLEWETSHILTRTGHLEPQKSPFNILYTICQSTRDLNNQRRTIMKQQSTSQFYIQVSRNTCRVFFSILFMLSWYYYEGTHIKHIHYCYVHVTHILCSFQLYLGG